ncbi:MAG: nitroreductase [Clostridiales bacterium]|nr:nitroreductase [Clostridiales bacterium]
MELKEAMSQRHTVRKYSSEPLSDAEVQNLTERVDKLNSEYGLAIRLVQADTAGLNAFAKTFMSSGVKDYFVLAASAAPDAEERLGYASADLMLYAQTIGLNTWWIGGTFNKKHTSELAPGMFVPGIVVVGHGAAAGVPHKSKPADKVSEYKGGSAPEWFAAGVEAALLAPTALNRQKFMLTGEGNKVALSYAPGPMSGADKGIVKYHFELGAGKENFEWV